MSEPERLKKWAEDARQKSLDLGGTSSAALELLAISASYEQAAMLAELADALWQLIKEGAG